MEYQGGEEQMYRAGDAVVYVGQVKEEVLHSHSAVQLVVGIKGKISITGKDNTIKVKSAVINQNAAHAVDSESKDILILWLNPASSVGYFLGQHHISKDIESYEEEWISYLSMFAKDLLAKEINASTFVSAIINSMAEFYFRCLEAKFDVDKHITTSLQYLDRHTRYTVSSAELADELCMEETELLELFESHTGISYDHIARWKLVLNSFEMTRKKEDLPHTARLSDYSDQKKYTSLFMKFFGIAPSQELLSALF